MSERAKPARRRNQTPPLPPPTPHNPKETYLPTLPPSLSPNLPTLPTKRTGEKSATRAPIPCVPVSRCFYRPGAWDFAYGRKRNREIVGEGGSGANGAWKRASNTVSYSRPASQHSRERERERERGTGRSWTRPDLTRFVMSCAIYYLPSLFFFCGGCGVFFFGRLFFKKKGKKKRKVSVR